MTEAVAIVQQTAPYLQYIAAPLLIFSALASADMIVDFVIQIVRAVKKSYKV